MNANDYYLNVAVWNWFKYLEIFTILDRYIGIISLSITKYNKSKSDEHQSESDRLCCCGQINRRFCRFRSAGQSSMIPVNLLAAGRTRWWWWWLWPTPLTLSFYANPSASDSSETELPRVIWSMCFVSFHPLNVAITTLFFLLSINTK